ncbi:MAG TPA: hypothetical protein PK668_25015 [Myxococcota bacterium]|nr:hypothetical protein [Myxococcota bacterium]HRY96797.1 hypothetical protein [Myxococcota bacterium]
MADWLHRCWTKATTAEGDAVRRSFSWVIARRGFLKVFADRLECGSWVIPYADMSEAVLFSTRQLFFHGYVLRVKAGGRTYQFGLNPGRFWEGELPFPVKRQEMAMGYSWYSIAIRLAALVSIAYLLLKDRPGCSL